MLLWSYLIDMNNGFIVLHKSIDMCYFGDGGAEGSKQWLKVCTSDYDNDKVNYKYPLGHHKINGSADNIQSYIYTYI